MRQVAFAESLEDTPKYKQKMHSDDRLLVLRPIDGAKAYSGTGLIDPRLFKKGQSLHAKMEPQSTLWSMNYEYGVLPKPLTQKFTSFPQLYKYAKEYFKRRNIEITEVIG